MVLVRFPVHGTADLDAPHDADLRIPGPAGKHHHVKFMHSAGVGCILRSPVFQYDFGLVTLNQPDTVAGLFEEFVSGLCVPCKYDKKRKKYEDTNSVFF